MKTLSPAVIILPWRPDAAEYYFAPLSHQPWAMLLHSGHAEHPHNRFDILVADPVATLSTHGEETRVRDKHGTTTTADDP
ncbi:para-aminobenzoate synthase component I [Citrobacter koseri]|nr:para-aminobenzoate synthase component I [Citrobacter koseri]